MTTYTIETQDRAGNWDAYGPGGPDVQTFDSHDAALAALDSARAAGLLDGETRARIVERVDGKVSSRESA